MLAAVKEEKHIHCTSLREKLNQPSFRNKSNRAASMKGFRRC